MNTKYRPITGSIEAFQWLPHDLHAQDVFTRVLGATNEAQGVETDHLNRLHFQGPTKHHVVAPGDWLVRNDKGFLWTFPNEMFARFFEPAQYAGQESRLDLVQQVQLLQNRADHVSTIIESARDLLLEATK